MALQALKIRESFSDKAYHMLREAILTGGLKPGEQLTEEALYRRLVQVHRFVPVNMSAIDSGRIAKTEMRRSVWMSLTCSGSTHRYSEKVRLIITISFPKAALRRDCMKRKRGEVWLVTLQELYQ